MISLVSTHAISKLHNRNVIKCGQTKRTFIYINDYTCTQYFSEEMDV